MIFPVYSCYIMISPSCSHHFPTISLFCPQFDRWKPHLPRPAAEFPQFPRRWRHPILADVDAPHVDCVENRIFLCTVDINQIILYTMCIYMCVSTQIWMYIHVCILYIWSSFGFDLYVCMLFIMCLYMYYIICIYTNVCMYIYIYVVTPSMIYLEAFYMGITICFCI